MSSAAIIGDTREELAEINDVNSVKQRYAINLRGSVHDRAIAIRDVVLLGDDLAARNQQITLIDDLAAFYAESETRLNAMLADTSISTSEEIAIDARIDDIQAKTNPLVDEIITLVERENWDAAHTLLMNEAAPLFTDWLGVINEFIGLQDARSKAGGAAVSETIDGYTKLTVIILLGSLAVIAVAGFTVTRSITTPLDALRRGVGAMIHGEAKLKPELLQRKDEIGRFAAAVVELQTHVQSTAQAHTNAFLAEAEARDGAAHDARNAIDMMSAALSKMPGLRRRGQVMPAVVLRWLPQKCATLRKEHPKPHVTSKR